MTDLQSQAIALLPGAIEFISRVAGGQAPGPGFYRTRTRDVLSATKLLLTVAGGELPSLSREDLTRLEKISRRNEELKQSRQMLLGAGVPESTLDLVLNALVANELTPEEFAQCSEEARGDFIERVIQEQTSPVSA